MLLGFLEGRMKVGEGNIFQPVLTFVLGVGKVLLNFGQFLRAPRATARESAALTGDLLWAAQSRLGEGLWVPGRCNCVTPSTLTRAAGRVETVRSRCLVLRRCSTSRARVWIRVRGAQIWVDCFDWLIDLKRPLRNMRHAHFSIRPR